MRSLMLVVALGMAGCAETPKEAASRAAAADRTRADLDRELAGLVPGTPQSCINQIERRDVRSFGDTLVYRAASGIRYVTQAPGCAGAGDTAILITNTPNSQLCRGDIATLVDNASRVQVGSCSFGDFTPYRKP